MLHNVLLSHVLADIYMPVHTRSKLPTVLLVAGYPDEGFRCMVGCHFKDMRHTTSWASLLASVGFAAITYSPQDPIADLLALMDALSLSTATPELDPSRIAIWATSGNVPTALTALTERSDTRIQCAAFLYGYMLDHGSDSWVSTAARSFHFAVSRTTLDDLRRDVPVFIARAGQDECPGLNASIDRFVVEGLKRSLRLTFLNHPNAPHAFDLTDDTAETRSVVQSVIDFLTLRMECRL